MHVSFYLSPEFESGDLFLLLSRAAFPYFSVTAEDGRLDHVVTSGRGGPGDAALFWGERLQGCRSALRL